MEDSSSFIHRPKIAKESRIEATHGSLPDDHPFVQAVKSVCSRLMTAAEIEDNSWDVQVAHAPKTAKVRVLLGTGKVVVDSGLSNVANTEEELAAILSHGISHEIAGHLSESLSQLYFFGWTSIPMHCAFVRAACTAFSISTVSAMILPTSFFLRIFADCICFDDFSCEEADDIGMLLLTEAGYDLEADDAESGKLKQPPAAGKMACLYHAHNQDTLRREPSIAKWQNRIRRIRTFWSSSDNDESVRIARKSNWDEYLRAKRQAKASTPILEDQSWGR
ncbi:MAG: hypothetical protein Q9208_004799 [Pyrenodesmia sp. 3 TL-2023]